MTRDEGRPTGELSGQPVLEIAIDRNGAEVVVSLTGELDLDGTRRLAEKVREASAPGIETLALDLRALDFVDSAGLQAVLMARDSCQEAGIAFRLVGVSPNVARVMQLAGVETLLSPPDATS